VGTPEEFNGSRKSSFMRHQTMTMILENLIKNLLSGIGNADSDIIMLLLPLLKADSDHIPSRAH